MKSEERHHLAENDLEQTLNRWLDRIEPYSNHILGGLLLATAVAVGGILWQRTAQAKADVGWTLFADAKSASDFLSVAESYPDSPAADWASLRAARMFYDRGVEVSLTDRAASDGDFLQAKDLFEKLLNKPRVAKEIREGTLDGMARTLEATSNGDVTEAIKAYERLISEFPDSIYKDYAQHRIDVLKSPEATEFYAWFRKQNPKPADRPQPNDSGATSGLTIPGLPELPLSTSPEKTETETTTVEPPAATPPMEEAAPAVTSPETPSSEPAAPAVEPEAQASPETKPEPEAPAGEEVKPAAEGETPAEVPPATEQAPPASEPAPEASSDAESETPPPSAQ